MVRLTIFLLISFLLSSAHSAPLASEEAASPTTLPPPLFPSVSFGPPFAFSSSSGAKGSPPSIGNLLASLFGPSSGGAIATGSGTADDGAGSGFASGPGPASALGVGANGIGFGTANVRDPSPSPPPNPATSANPLPPAAPPAPSPSPEPLSVPPTTENGLEEVDEPATASPEASPVEPPVAPVPDAATLAFQVLNQTNEVTVGVADLPGDGIAAVSSVNVTESDSVDSASGTAAAVGA